MASAHWTDVFWPLRPKHTVPWNTINQGLLQPQGELYPSQSTFNHRSRDQLLKFRTSFYETISSEFLAQGNLKHTQCSREHWYWRNWLELATSLTESERCIAWANLTYTLGLFKHFTMNNNTFSNLFCNPW